MLVWMFGKNIGHQTKDFFKEGNQHLITFGLVLIITSRTWYLDFCTVSKTPNINSFFFDFLQRNLNDQ
jgi:hypothetical protein